jgi:hypothetical protein
MANSLYNISMFKKAKKRRGLLKGKQNKRRQNLLVDAGKASTRAMREYGPVFEELAKYDKKL